MSQRLITVQLLWCYCNFHSFILLLYHLFFVLFTMRTYFEFYWVPGQWQNFHWYPSLRNSSLCPSKLMLFKLLLGTFHVHIWLRTMLLCLCKTFYEWLMANIVPKLSCFLQRYVWMILPMLQTKEKLWRNFQRKWLHHQACVVLIFIVSLLSKVSTPSYIR